MKKILAIFIICFAGCNPDKLFTKNGNEYYIDKTCISGHNEMILIYDVTLGVSLPHNSFVCDQYKVDTIFTGNKRVNQ